MVTHTGAALIITDVTLDPAAASTSSSISIFQAIRFLPRVFGMCNPDTSVDLEGMRSRKHTETHGNTRKVILMVRLKPRSKGYWKRWRM
ncbi:hypothetical protein RRG08_037189 [Elysia crispata]|uniref:Uncharacterized protein n=1 Tax=Elysia crispata TaxID=231223 RepID=A0AAE1D9D8_9GAST|nr:hypothetical protein RRG08_037189 [Elysia crispata]